MGKRIIVLLCSIPFIYLNALARGNDTLSYKFENREGFYYGVNLGMHIASPNDAMFYNGGLDKVNSIDKVLDYTSGYNISGGYRDRLENVLNDIIDTVLCPYSMSYKPTVLIGLTGGYNFTNFLGLYFDLDYMRLKTTGVYTMILESPVSTTSVTDVNKAEGAITGLESRVLCNIGLHRVIETPKKVNPYVDAGVNITYAKVEQHNMHYESFSANLVNYQRRESYEPIKEQTGTGIGMNAGIGLQMPLTYNFYIMLGYEFLYSDNVIAGNGHDPSHSFLLRFFF